MVNTPGGTQGVTLRTDWVCRSVSKEGDELGCALTFIIVVKTNVEKDGGRRIPESTKHKLPRSAGVTGQSVHARTTTQTPGLCV